MKNLTIDESLKIIKDAGLKVESSDQLMADKMKFWHEAHEMIEGAAKVLKKENLAEYSSIGIYEYRFRRDDEDKCAEVDISLITKTRRFRLNLHGFQYRGSKLFDKRILKRLDDFEDPTEFAYLIDQYLTAIESEL
jgi:hypothetical protein